MVTRHESRPSNFVLCYDHENKGTPKDGSLWALRAKLVPKNMGVCFDHADSFETVHFDQDFHLISWLKVNNDTVFEAIVLEYGRYESTLGAR